MSTKASLADEALGEQRHAGLACTVSVVIADIGQDELDRALAAANRAAVTRALRKRGYKLGDQALTRHLTGACGCARR